MHRKTLTHGRVAVTGDGFQALDKIDLAVGSGDVEWVPCQLGGAEMNLGVEWQKAGLELSLQISIEFRVSSSSNLRQGYREAQCIPCEQPKDECGT